MSVHKKKGDVLARSERRAPPDIKNIYLCSLAPFDGLSNLYFVLIDCRTLPSSHSTSLVSRGV